MSILTTVLAAIDLTPEGRRVADRGRLIAEELGISLTILHTVESTSDSFIPSGIAALLAEHQSKATHEVAEWCRSRGAAEVHVDIRKGSPSWEIGRSSQDVELLLVGSSSLETGRAGPITRRVVEATRSDVIVVRRTARVPYRRAVIGVDFSEASAQTVARAMDLAPGAEITLVHGLPTRFERFMSDAGMFPEEVDLARKHRIESAETALDEFASRWPEVRKVVMVGPTVEVITEIARRRSADLVAVGSRGANATRMVLLGSAPSMLMDAAPCDLAVIRIPGEFRRP